MDKSNVGQRVLGARKRLRGGEDSLDSILGMQMPDGAQCFVISEQANFRFVSGSLLAADEHCVVVPAGPESGRWVREGGLIGFAILKEGREVAATGAQRFSIGKYAKQQLVQFSVSGDSVLVYTGSAPRLAIVDGRVSHGRATITIDEVEAEPGLHLLKPASKIALFGTESCVASLQAALL